MNSIILISVAFQLISSVDLRLYYSDVYIHVNVHVCLGVCTNNTQNIDIVTLGTCMGP